MSEGRGTVGGGWDSAVNASEMQAAVPQSAGGGPKNGAFIDQSETVVAAIGSGYLQSYLTGGGVGKGIGILTQKRFYYKGRNFAGAGKNAKYTTEEGVVSIEDITFTKFSHTRHIGQLIMGIFFALIGMAIISTPVPESVAFLGPLFLLAALAGVVMFFVNRHTLFVVSFPGGDFAFDIHYYPITDIRDFQRQLHLLKDHIKEGVTV